MRPIRIRTAMALAALAAGLFAVSPEAHAQARRPRAKVNPATINRGNAHRSRANVYHRGYNGLRPGYGTPVVGGRYVPGYGVTGGGFPGSYPVVGGLYAPGFGVMGTPPTPVVGGSYIPGFGVTGGAVGAQRVQGGTYIPGYGVR